MYACMYVRRYSCRYVYVSMSKVWPWHDNMLLTYEIDGTDLRPTPIVCMYTYTFTHIYIYMHVCTDTHTGIHRYIPYVRWPPQPWTRKERPSRMRPPQEMTNKSPQAWPMSATRSSWLRIGSVLRLGALEINRPPQGTIQQARQTDAEYAYTNHLCVTHTYRRTNR